MALPPFQRFLDDNRDAVFGFLFAAVGPDDVDDCFQDTFAAALRAYPRLRARSNLRAWVLTIAHRKAIDAHRAQRRRPLPVEDPEPVAAGAGAGVVAVGSVTGGHAGGDPAAGAVADGRDELWRAVAALPPKQGQAVLLRYAGDLAYADVARAMGCSEVAARRSVHEGLKKLKEVVER
jgi:RNA polymerase sigma factor (sigma-70 family)